MSQNDTIIDYAIAADGTVTRDASGWDHVGGIAVEVIQQDKPLHAFMSYDTVTEEALKALANIFDRHGESVGWLHNIEYDTSHQVEYRGDWFKFPDYFRQWYGAFS